MRPHHRKALSPSLAALVGAFAALSIATAVQAATLPAPAVKSPPPALQRVDDRCPPGFHGVPAPNGNNYRCVEDDRWTSDP